MIENKIYCYINGFLKWNNSKKIIYIVRNKKFTRRICILNLRNKRKNIFARAIIRYYMWKKITKETGKIIIKSTCRWNIRESFKVGSSLNFSNLDVLEIISWVALSSSFWSKITTPFPLPSFVIMISLFFLRFCKIRFW